MNPAKPTDPVAQAQSAVVSAQQTLHGLIAQRGNAADREARLKAERSKIAFSAHGEDDAKAKSRLSAIHRELAELGSELDAFAAAIDEAKARLAAAQEAARCEVEKQRAREALAHGEAMQAAAAGCDAALQQFLASYEALDRACAAACGIVQRPSRQTVRVAAKRALIAALTSHRLAFDTELLAPNERHTFAEITLAWHHSIEAWAAQRLAEPEPKDNGEEIAA